MAGVSGVIGRSVPSPVVGGSEAEGEIVTVPVQRGRGITVRGWEVKSYPVTPTTVQVLFLDPRLEMLALYYKRVLSANYTEFNI